MPRRSGAVEKLISSGSEVTEDFDRERLAAMFDQAPGLMALLMEPQHRVVLANKAFLSLAGTNEVIGKTVIEVLPQVVSSDALAALNGVYRSGRPIRRTDVRLPVHSDHGAFFEEHVLDLILQPITDGAGDVTGIFVQGSDVTERVRAEQRLQSSLAIKTVGIIYWGPDFGLTQVNDAFLQMAGFTREEAIGLTWQELTPREFWPQSERAVEQVNTIGEAVPYEKQYYRKDGSRWWGLFAPRRVSEEEVIEFVLDVTERRQAEEAFAQEKRRLQLIVDSATDYAILTLDPDRLVTSWSPGAEATFGFKANEIIGRSGDILFTHEDRAASVPQAEAKNARENGCAADVRWHLRKDGSQVFVNGSSNLLKDEAGEELGFLKIAKDETKRRRAELKLRDAEERYRLAAQATKDAIWDWDLASDTIRWNEAVEHLFGYTAGEIEACANWWKDRVHPDDRDRVVSSIEAALSGEQDSWLAEYRFQRIDRGYAVVLDRGTVLRDDNGRALRMVGAMHDLTTHKEDEARLRQLNETLENRVVEEVSARLKTEEALRQSQKLEAIGQLTGGVAHDFNNLLTVIRGGAEILRRPDLSEEKRARYIDAIADTADRAAKLTGQLLAFSRRQALRPEVFDAGERLETVKDMLRTVVGARVVLTTDADCEICYVEADPPQFETALVNLAVNARDAMDAAGNLNIKVRPADRVPGVRGHAPAAGEFVAVAVSDTGCGIAPEHLGLIFEPFFTTKEVGKGTGLGLSQVYGFAKQSGGEVEVVSTVGEGTTFTLYLPRAAPKLGSAVEAIETVPEALGPRGHILVVEDNEQVGSFCTQLISELGFDTTWASSADEALELLDENDQGYAAVFSDVVMPGMNGVQLGLELRRRVPGLPVILTSGYSQVLAQEGSHGFQLLQKPYSIEELNRVLTKVIRERSGSA